MTDVTRPSKQILKQLLNQYKGGKFNDVIEQANILIKKFPEAFIVWNIMGAAYQSLGRSAEALRSFKKVTELNDSYAEGYNNLGAALRDQGEFDRSVVALQRAIFLRSSYAEALNNLGVTFRCLGRFDEAAEAYNKALSFKPDYAEACYNLGVSLQKQNKLRSATEAYQRAIALSSNYAEAHYNLGLIFQSQSDLDKATEAFKRAVNIRSDYTEALNNLGISLRKQGKIDEALAAYRQAHSTNPDYAEVCYNMGVVFQDKKDPGEAIDWHARALSVNPDYEAARAQLLHQQAHICDWDGIEESRCVLPLLGTVKQAIAPFSVLSLEDCPKRHLLRAELYVASEYNKQAIPFEIPPPKQSKRLHIGYFSSDFDEHPVAYLIVRMLEIHDRNRFEISGFSLKPMNNNSISQRICRSFDSFEDVSNLSDEDVVSLARNRGIDIAIDLNGHTQNARTRIFAYRAAPIQINYLGYPGTTGATFMDYIVADQILIPPQSQKYYSESPIYLPNTFMPTDDGRKLSQRGRSKEELGLTRDGFVFCCFNSNYKISEVEFDIWMRLLRNVESSVLWLRESNKLSKSNLLLEAEKKDIDPSRLVFAGNVAVEEHLARYQLADLFLDTFIYNAHSTATEALWAGLPIVTMAGKSFASRVSASLLHSVGLSELITDNLNDYETLVLELANNPDRLRFIKDKLSHNRLKKPLFKTEGYTRNLEKAFERIHLNFLDGKPPQPIFVP